MNPGHQQFPHSRFPLSLLGLVLLGAIIGWQAKRPLHHGNITVEVLSGTPIEIKAPVWEESSYE